MAVARVTEIIAASTESLEDAIRNGIARADKTLDNIEGAWVQDIKATVKNGQVEEWRVGLKVTFVLND